MYPRINELLKNLHTKQISSFMVTNAQFPGEIANLDPCTQLYVSVDASTKESLKAVDRPLFKDFWERFNGSLESLARKQQRTVYRLTLVKSWNMTEAREYAKLIEIHQPDFIEIKAVTYCGKSDGSSLTMENVPWHKEVCAYCEAIIGHLADSGNSVTYSIATEHEHSCCVLLAREDKFKVEGVWHTWIDYEKFNQLITRYYDSDGKISFTGQDYMAHTPSWALYQSEEKGFDPVENRWRRNRKGEKVERDYKSSESGCG
jgi:tRNA wybutosine-synthesizing protein 1